MRWVRDVLTVARGLDGERVDLRLWEVSVEE